MKRMSQRPQNSPTALFSLVKTLGPRDNTVTMLSGSRLE
jgi:hypothetical protein